MHATAASRARDRRLTTTRQSRGVDRVQRGDRGRARCATVLPTLATRGSPPPARARARSTIDRSSASTNGRAPRRARTRRAWLLHRVRAGTRAPPARADSLAAEFLARDGVDDAAFSLAFELRHDLPHHSPNIGGTTSNRSLHRRADLRRISLGGQITLEERDLGPLLVRELLAAALLVQIHRLAPFLDAFAQDVDDVIVGEVALDRDLLIHDVGEHRAERQRSGFVLGFARSRELGLQSPSKI